MSKYNLVGMEFGRLIVVSEAGRNNKKQILWTCKCACGQLCTKTSASLVSKGVKSCGCLHKESCKTRKPKHGLSRTKAYQSWSDAKQRCYNTKHPEYKRYGAIGIMMSDIFLNDPVAWCEYIGSPPDNKHSWSVDRINPCGNYEEGNLQWALPAQQTRNQKKQKNNSSGHTGVYGVVRNDIPVGYLAQWRNLKGEKKSSFYSTTKYGDEFAFFLACEKRDLEIMKLNLLGAGYTEQHGK